MNVWRQNIDVQNGIKTSRNDKHNRKSQQIAFLHLKQRSSLPLLITTNLKVLTPLQNNTTDKLSLMNPGEKKQRNIFILSYANLDGVLGYMFASLALQP